MFSKSVYAESKNTFQYTVSTRDFPVRRLLAFVHHLKICELLLVPLRASWAQTSTECCLSLCFSFAPAVTISIYYKDAWCGQTSGHYYIGMCSVHNHEAMFSVPACSRFYSKVFLLLSLRDVFDFSFWIIFMLIIVIYDWHSCSDYMLLYTIYIGLFWTVPVL